MSGKRLKRGGQKAAPPWRERLHTLVLQTSSPVLFASACIAFYLPGSYGVVVPVLLGAIAARWQDSLAQRSEVKLGAQGKRSKGGGPGHESMTRREQKQEQAANSSSSKGQQRGGQQSGRTVFKRGIKREGEGSSLEDLDTPLGMPAGKGGRERGQEQEVEGDGDDDMGATLSWKDLHEAISRPRGCRGRDMSLARWLPDEGVAEALRCRGKLWTTMGIVRGRRTLLLVEEAVFLVERGVLLLLLHGEDDPRFASVQEAFSLLEPLPPAQRHPVMGLSLDAYLAYAYLRRLGYVVGRHRVPWAVAKPPRRTGTVKLEPGGGAEAVERPMGEEEEGGERGGKHAELQAEAAAILPETSCTAMPAGGNSGEGEAPASVKDQIATSTVAKHASSPPAASSASLAGCALDLSDEGMDAPGCASCAIDTSHMHSDSYAASSSSSSSSADLTPIFDVYPPNARFSKKKPGLILFSLVVCSGPPPSRAQVQTLEGGNCGGPLKFACVEGGVVSIFSFNTVSLPVLP